MRYVVSWSRLRPSAHCFRQLLATLRTSGGDRVQQEGTGALQGGRAALSEPVVDLSTVLARLSFYRSTDSPRSDSVTCSATLNDMPGTTHKADLTRRKLDVNPLSIKLSRVGKADCSAPLPVREYHTVRVRDADSGRSVQLVFSETHVVGEGSFGIVTCAQLYSNNEHERGVVALKRTRQDKRFKCREMQIISAVLHPNIVKLRYYWYEADEQSDDLFLNLMFEYLVRPFPCPSPYIGDVED